MLVIVVAFSFVFQGCSFVDNFLNSDFLSDFNIDGNSEKKTETEETTKDEPNNEEELKEETPNEEKPGEDPGGEEEENNNNGAIMANHNNATLADLNSIPIEWFTKAQSDLHIYYNHTSHGSQVTTGMSGLISFANGIESGKGDYFQYSSSGDDGMQLWDTWNTDLGNSSWDAIARDFIENNKQVNVVMWSWCGQVRGSSEAAIEEYLSKMSALEEEFPTIKFIYMTGHTDGSGEEGNLNLRNNQIREYCQQNEKILFDFADIECYDPDGNYYMDKYCSDECQYDSNGDGELNKNWAVDWQNSHTENTDWYSCSSAHSQPINANMKAYAA